MTKKANRSLRSLSDLRLTPRSLKVRQTPSIFLAWLPLAVMWAIMAIEQPVITAVIARMSHATLQLAAFGIAFSLALFIEGSIVQMLAAGTAIANNRENYKRLLTMMHIIGGMATMIHAILCIPAVFRSFAVMVLGIPEELIIPSRSTFSIMLPWTLAVGYRRLWQGVLIRYGRTRVIPVTMVVRILVIIITLWWSFAGQRIGGSGRWRFKSCRWGYGQCLDGVVLCPAGYERHAFGSNSCRRRHHALGRTHHVLPSTGIHKLHQLRHPACGTNRHGPGSSPPGIPRHLAGFYWLHLPL